MDHRIVIEFSNGHRIWVNPQHIVKMEKTVDGRYFIYLSNGEYYEISLHSARIFENYLEDYLG